MTHPGPTAGFTLLELLVVLAILGLAAGLAFPAIDRGIRVQAFHTASLQVDLAVRSTRADAIRQNRTVAVPAFSGKDDDVAIGFAKASMASSIRIEQSGPIRFFRDGTSNGGTVQLSTGGHKFRMMIDAPTGTITSESL